MLAEGDAVVVFADIDDDGAPLSGAGLSEALGCVAFSAGVHDDDIFFFEIHDRGNKLISGAVPDPFAYFGIDPDVVAEMDPDMIEPFGPVGDGGGESPDPGSLVAALGRGNEAELRAAFTADFVFATERHEAIVSALSLPKHAAGWGYRYLSNDGGGYSGPPLTRV